MGNSASAQQGPATEQNQPYFGVRISAELLDSIGRSDEERAHARHVVNQDWSDRERVLKRTFALHVQKMRNEHQEELRHALEKNERENIERVDKYIAALRKRDYKAPERKPVCEAERLQCLDCYQQNGTNPVACRKVIEAFVACAEAEKEEYLERAVRSSGA